ncbi:MAG: c-type cytochrome [Chloroflexi bacterium]|nr:c-type cytochrome [Chloroflexota bacterium]
MKDGSGLSRWPVFVALGMLVVISVVFLVEFAVSTGAELQKTPSATLDAASYQDEVLPLLADADPQRGAALVEEHNCIACHRMGAENNIAPPFQGLAARAGLRRPPLSAEAYVYESITHPTAYVVEGFSPAMPQNYPDLLTGRDLGDIIAYLLSPDAY